MADDKLPRDPLRRELMAIAARPARPFVHLRVHSAYSLLEGALPLSKVVAQAAKDSAPAVAVTDTNNLFGALEFAQKAVKEGVQPIIACQLDFSFPGVREESSRSVARRQGPELFALVLIAANEAGYRNLVRLVSRAYLETHGDAAVHLPLEILDGFADGIICLTGGPRGPIGRALKSDHPQFAEERLLALKDLFGDRLYVEIERLAGYDRALEAATIDLAYRHDLPLVATNEAFFLTREDFDAHDALMAIAEGSVIAEDNRRRLTQDNHLRSQAEMAALFRRHPRGDRQYDRDRAALLVLSEDPRPDPAALCGPRCGRQRCWPSRRRPPNWHGRRATG